jgi:hypothetical protein
VSSLLGKLGVGSRGDAARLAHEQGLLGLKNGEREAAN